MMTKRRLDPADQIIRSCPVECLGVREHLCFYRDTRGQLRVYHLERHDREGILSLFRDQERFLRIYFPDGSGDWDEERASEYLIATCAKAGVAGDLRKLGFDIDVVLGELAGKWL
jgi:hypothetical protein